MALTLAGDRVNMAAGRHRISYKEGHVYEGEWSEDGRKEGAGVLSLGDGSKYVGEFSGGLSQVC